MVSKVQNFKGLGYICWCYIRLSLHHNARNKQRKRHILSVQLFSPTVYFQFWTAPSGPPKSNYPPLLSTVLRGGGRKKEKAAEMKQPGSAGNINVGAFPSFLLLLSPFRNSSSSASHTHTHTHTHTHSISLTVTTRYNELLTPLVITFQVYT